MAKPKLSCGGKGPCCHVGYSHRHCEHCDEVVATRQSQVQWYPVVYPAYPAYQPLPSYPWYSGGLYPSVGITSGTHAFTTTADNTTTTTTVLEWPEGS